MVLLNPSNKNVELTKLKTDLDTNGILYITDNAVATQKNINFNKEDITTKITSINPQNYSQAVSTNIKNIVTDATSLNNKSVLNRVRASYNNGCKIVIKGDNIKVIDAFQLMYAFLLFLSHLITFNGFNDSICFLF